MKKNFYHQPKAISAFEAKFNALKISFSPVTFQVSFCLYELGILAFLSTCGEKGETAKEIALKLNLSEYGVKVLLDVGLSMNLIWFKDDKFYVLDKTGLMFLSDPMVKVNLEFIQHTCYQGLFYLLDAIKTGKPEGLKVFGNWQSIYPALTSLPEKAQQSWFNFDHYYSDKSFKDLLKLVFKQKPKTLLDIGGNTGKWTLSCFNYDDNIRVTIADLPQQLEVAKKKVSEAGFSERFSAYPINLLDQKSILPQGFDSIWMSQFLDCFSEDEILSILEKVKQSMNETTRVYILELFWDRQAFEPASFSINCTSIYFTAMANGNSRMYHSKDLIKLIHQVGLVIENDVDDIGPGHTLLVCRK